MTRGRAKPCVDHLGRAYPSERAMCAAWGTTTQTLRVRLAEGRTLEQALTDPRRDRGVSRRRPVTVDGVAYESVTAAAEAIGVSPAGLRWRLRPTPRRPWTSEDLRFQRVERVLDRWRARRTQEAAE